MGGNKTIKWTLDLLSNQATLFTTASKYQNIIYDKTIEFLFSKRDFNLCVGNGLFYHSDYDVWTFFASHMCHSPFYSYNAWVKHDLCFLSRTNVYSFGLLVSYKKWKFFARYRLFCVNGLQWMFVCECKCYSQIFLL